MTNSYSGAFQISFTILVINGLANSDDAYTQNYLLIPGLPILMAGSVILINDNIISNISLPPPCIPLEHYDTLCLGPWHGSCSKILLTIIVIIMSRQSESAQSSLSPPPVHMSPYRPRQGAHAACYDRKKFYRLSGARNPQCVTQAAL